MTPPGMVLLGSGRNADVYALDETRVLRRYRDGGDVSAEAAVMAHVAAHGYPVPTVHEAAGADLVLERLTGPTMLAAFGTGDMDVRTGAELLADLHARLHALPGRDGAERGTRILHLDLHPDNVMLEPRGPVVIDWRNAAEGPPDLDVALTAVILAQVAVGAALDLAETAGGFLAEFLRCVGGDPGRRLDRALAMRAADPAMTPEETGRLVSAAALIRTLL